MLAATVRVILRITQPAMSDSDRSDIAALVRASCAAEARRRGAAAAAVAVMGELFDLLSLPVRRRFDPNLLVTGRPISGPSGPVQGPLMTLKDDFTRACRRLRSNAGTLWLAIGLLSLAIGITTAMFTIVDALVLHPVPFRDPDRLTAVVVGVENGRGYIPTADAAALRAWRSSGAFEDVAAAMQNPVALDSGQGLVTKPGARITPGLLEMLGVRPLLGRSFTAGEGRQGTDDRMLISEDLWQSMFNRDPGILGRRVRVAGVSTEIVGIMPSGFRFPYSRTVAWLPIDFDAPAAAPRRSRPMVFARTKAGVPTADAVRIADHAARAEGALTGTEQTLLRPIAAGMVDKYSRRAITALAGGVGLVFLVLCANAMNLMLTRFSARQREFGMCSALGASRGRLMREAVFETMIVATLASAAGLLLASATVALAAGLLPAQFLSSTLTPVTMSWRAVAATSILGLIAAAISGVTPAWMATRVDAADSLRILARGGTETASRRRLSRGLLIAEVAMATALLAGASLLVRTFVNLTQADRGLNAAGVVTGWVALPEFAFKERSDRLAFAAAFEDRLKAVPGARQVTLAAGMPPSAGSIYFGSLQTVTPSGRDVPMDELNIYNVTPKLFDLLGIRLVAGRTFSEPSSGGEVIIGEGLARMLWPDGNALGQSFKFERAKELLHVVGVAAEIRTPTLDPRLDRPEVYFPLVVDRNGIAEASSLGSGQIDFALRCDATCPGLDVLRQVVRSVSAQAEVVRIGPMEGEYLKDLERPRAAAALGATFAGVALLASTIGLFGVLTAAVARRRREFGIRIALGIDPPRLRGIVLADAVRLGAAGLGCGVLAAWALTRGLASLTYGVSATDPRSWALVCAALAVAILAATWRPAAQAARVDPVALLREE